MNIHRLNLNLVKVFIAMYTENNVSKAAEKLFLSQSATSMALNQLRKQLKDPLFVRQGSEMVATVYAHEIAPTIQAAFADLEKVFTKGSQFDPAASEREFRIGTSEYTQMIFLPKLLSILKKEAPGIKITAVHFRMCSTINPFENKLIDVGIGMLRQLPSTCRSEVLFEERPVLIGHKSHPAFRKGSNAKEVFHSQHIQWCCDIFNIQSVINEYFEKHHLKRENIIRASDFLSCLLALKENNHYLSAIPEQLALKVYKHFNLMIQETKLKHWKAPIAMFYPHRSQDLGLLWLLDKVRQTAILINK